MKILASGDLHGDRKLTERLAEKAEKENVDLVILAGDISHFDARTENMIGPFLKRGKKVLFVPGNHETLATADFLAEVYGPEAKNLHGYSVLHKGVGIFGCGGATIGPNLRLEEDEIFELLQKGFKYVKDSKKKIMVTHVHPAESIIERMTEFFRGSTSVRKAIDKFKPDILLCAHVHEAAGIEEKIGNTRVINVSKSEKIIEI